MTKIVFTTDNGSGSIQWAAAEEFNELMGKQFNLSEMEAAQALLESGKTPAYLPAAADPPLHH